jgi:xylan 1,4-beta-xylosidase
MSIMNPFRTVLAALGLVVITFGYPGWSQAAPTNLSIDANALATPFPHFWEQMFGSGRAVLALRDNYRQDLKEVHNRIGMRYVRFHGIFLDDVGVYDEDDKGNPVFNFSYVDQIYDGLLARGVRPFVEISFMPYKLAARRAPDQGFWDQQNDSPPKDYAKWDMLIRAFAQHLVDHYGIGEVSQWYFEVWNEPDLSFWAGEPKQATYFKLYDHTARALKAVSPRLRVGGPATSTAQWIPEFLNYVDKEHVPVDFVSTHGYADDTVEDLFGAHEDIPMRDRVCRAVQMVHGQIRASAMPALPLLWTEWNVPNYDDLNARDNWYVGPALARDISQCDGLVKMMSWWTFDDVFEEKGVTKEPFQGGFGLIAAEMIKKPSFYDFALLHELGDERLANPADNLLVTRRKDGALVVATWNLVDMDKVASGTPLTMRLAFKGIAPEAEASIQRVDEEHGNPMPAYRAMGSPRYPTQAQIAALNKASALPAPDRRRLDKGVLELTLPVNGLAVIEVSRK